MYRDDKMNSKRLVLTILFVLASVPILMAQQSAQATMKVQVTVIEGNSITMNRNTNLTLNKPGDTDKLTELSTVNFSREPGSVFMMERPEKMNLVGADGTNLEIPVIYIDRLTDQGITTELNLAPHDDTSLRKGTFRGTITTSVAYL